MVIEVDTTPSSPTLITSVVVALEEEERYIVRRPQLTTPLNLTSNITLSSQTQLVTPVHLDVQVVDKAFVMAYYSRLEPFMRRRIRELRLQAIATHLGYSSDDVDDEREMEAPHGKEGGHCHQERLQLFMEVLQMKLLTRTNSLSSWVKMVRAVISEGNKEMNGKQTETQLEEWQAPIVKAKPVTEGKKEPILMVIVVNKSLQMKEPLRIMSVGEMIFPPIRNEAPSVNPILNRGMALDRSVVASKEVKEMKKDGILRETRYQTWVANIVMGGDCILTEPQAKTVLEPV
uniref:Uncharacterized protein n=1 Tax=Tanacetum cinerariifolium TaxID=118510 RepID=A0A6L2L9B4_TANCI|nr:hypothetical protein [Tanacetum cinerariifolium]